MRWRVYEGQVKRCGGYRAAGGEGVNLEAHSDLGLEEIAVGAADDAGVLKRSPG